VDAQTVDRSSPHATASEILTPILQALIGSLPSGRQYRPLRDRLVQLVTDLETVASLRTSSEVSETTAIHDGRSDAVSGGGELSAGHSVNSIGARGHFSASKARERRAETDLVSQSQYSMDPWDALERL